MATYTWRGANGAFDDASSWSPAVIPGSSDTALFNANGSTVGGSGSVDTIIFSAPAASWTLSGQFTTNTASISNASSVTLNGGGVQLLVNGSFSATSSATLNLFNTAVLTVAQSASASFGAATLNLGSRAVGNFNGALSLGSGGATTATVDIALLTIGGVFSLGATASGSATLTVQDGAQVVVTAAADATRTYLQLGSVTNSAGVLRVSGPGSSLLLTQDSADIGVAGSGELDVSAGASARFSSSNNALNPALVIGVQRSGGGTVNLSDSLSSIAIGGSVIVGESGSGFLRITGGATLTSSAVTSAQAALAVGAATFGYGNLTIDGIGSQLVASGAAVIGGDNRGSGTSIGGTGSIAVTGGGLLQTNAMTVEAGSSITVDGTSQESVSGNLSLFGSVTSAGTLSISGLLSGSGSLVLGGGFTTVGNLAQTNVSFTGPDAALRIGGITGNSQVNGLQSGDTIDLIGNTNVSISGNSVNTSTGSLILAGSGPYTLSSDGSGGTFVTLGEDTVGVFRFFDSNYGTHFFTSSASEQSTIEATRPDLVYEGVGLQAVDPTNNDPDASPVYRFFDTSYGTHFFTASASERDTVIATRPDLVYEGTGFIEHTAEQPGDVAVYRFFDTHYGTHFYTASDSERATIVATRPDLAYEGVGFYAPS